MNNTLLVCFAFIGGICLAAQGGLNAQLGVLLKNPFIASVCAFVSSSFFALLFVGFYVKETPSIYQMKEVPYYLWFTGGLLSVIGISLYYITIPKLGIAKMISLGLCGQLLFSLFAGHFGWLNLPEDPISLTKLLGATFMILGIILINFS